MKLLVTDKFLDDIRKRDRVIGNKCQALMRELRSLSPQEFRAGAQPGWRLHQLRSSPFLSLSLDMATRILCELSGDQLYLHRLVHHDDYERVSINRNNAANQFTEISPDAITPDRLYDALLAVGIPSQSLGALRAISTENELLDALVTLPDDLQALALAVYEVSALALSRTTHHLLAPDEELLSMLQESTKDWDYYLHPTQSLVVQQPVASRLLVSGSAGTGKTVAAWYRAKYLIEQGHRCLFLCPNQSILSVSQHRLHKMLGGVGHKLSMTSGLDWTAVENIIDDFDHLIIDEAQDLSRRQVGALASDWKGQAIGLTAFYDFNQSRRLDVAPSKVSEEKSEIEKAFARAWNCNRWSLFVSYRNAREISSYVRKHVSSFLAWELAPNLSVFETGEVKEVTATGQDEVRAYVIQGVNALVKQYCIDDIALIWCAGLHGSWKKVAGWLADAGISTCKEGTGHGLLVTTAAKCKGHERKAVIAICPDLKSIGHPRRATAIYIALTRARDRLLVIRCSGEGTLGDGELI